MFLNIVKKAIVFPFIFIALNIYGQSEYHAINLSAFYPVSITNENDSVGVNINLLYSRVAQVDYFNLGLGATFIEGKMNGVQLGVGLTYINSVFSGFSFTAGANIHNNDVNGLDASVLTNMILGNLNGGAISGVFNFVIGNVQGFQISPFFNIAGSSAKALQLGNANIVAKNFSGFQLAFVFNFAGLKMNGLQTAIANLAGKNYGVQTGAVNVTHTQKGIQFGVFNKAVVSTGLQLGIINYSVKQKGIPVGLINISDDSKIRWLNYVSNFAVFISGIKLTSNKFYSIIEAGWNYQRTNNRESFTLGYRYGYDFELTPLLTISPDLGYIQIFDKSYRKYNDNNFLHQFAIQARCSVEYKINKFLRIFAGAGYSGSFILYQKNHVTGSKIIAFSGISIL